MFDRIRQVAGDNYQSFLAAGYRECTSDFWAESKKTPYFMEKWVRDAEGVKLFAIHALWYDWTTYNWDVPIKYSVSFEVQFNTRSSDTFNVDLLSSDHNPEGVESSDHNPEWVESFFMKIYTSVGCVPYGD